MEEGPTCTASVDILSSQHHSFNGHISTGADEVGDILEALKVGLCHVAEADKNVSDL